jgi:hypothetical protein
MWRRSAWIVPPPQACVCDKMTKPIGLGLQLSVLRGVICSPHTCPIAVLLLLWYRSPASFMIITQPPFVKIVSKKSLKGGFIRSQWGRFMIYSLRTLMISEKGGK